MNSISLFSAQARCLRQQGMIGSPIDTLISAQNIDNHKLKRNNLTIKHHRNIGTSNDIQ